jgi:hypothetical protein
MKHTHERPGKNVPPSGDAPNKGRFDNFSGILAGKEKVNKPMTIAEMNKIIASGWSGEISREQQDADA